ncbi:MAG: pirin family protein [Acidothermus sp.]|nr:pirin family protein [Acidothermus sp.]
MVDVRKAESRYVTEGEGVVSRHSFSFGAHYDPNNIRFGPLIAHNDELLDVGAGFPMHPHRGVDIVTWVVAGELRCLDDLGGEDVLGVGWVQLLHAGTGIRHAQLNGGRSRARFLQCWLESDDVTAPWRRAESVDLRPGEFCEIASFGSSRLLVAELAARTATPLDVDGLAHLFVVQGVIEVPVDGGWSASGAPGERLSGAGEQGASRRDFVLQTGDALRFAGRARLVVQAREGSSVLMWVMGEPTACARVPSVPGRSGSSPSVSPSPPGDAQ